MTWLWKNIISADLTAISPEIETITLYAKQIFLSKKMRKKEETDLAISIGLTNTHRHVLSTLKIMNQHYLKD